MRLRFTAGERERRPSRGQTKNARCCCCCCCCCCCYSLALFSPSKSFGAVERGGGRRQKARDDVFLLDRIDRVSSLFPKSSSKKSYTKKVVVVVVVVPSFLSSRRCGVAIIVSSPEWSKASLFFFFFFFFSRNTTKGPPLRRLLLKPFYAPKKTFSQKRIPKKNKTLNKKTLKP